MKKREEEGERERDETIDAKYISKETNNALLERTRYLFILVL